MNYALRFMKQASKDLQRLDLAAAKRVHRRLRELSVDPYDPYISYSLEMARGKRSFRVGDWRIFYQVNESPKTIEVLTIAPRGRAYRRL